MPSINIHLAVVNKYLEKHPAENREDFLRGTIAPDFIGDIEENHCSASDFEESPLKFLRGKVDLKKCTSKANFDSSFNKGYFLHLLTDYYFYNAMADDGKYFNDMSYDEFKKILYHDYYVLNDFLKQKFDVAFPHYALSLDISKKGEPLLLDREYVVSLVDRIGDVELEDYV